MTPQILKFAASAFMLAIMVMLLMYLTFIEVPEGNKDIIITILGVLLGAGAAAIPNLFGDTDKEKEELEKKVSKMEADMAVMKAVNETLQAQLTELRVMLVERHIVKGEGIGKI